MTADQAGLQNGSAALSLLLSGQDEEASKLMKVKNPEEEDGELEDSVAAPGACIECEGRWASWMILYIKTKPNLVDQPAQLHCTSCEDDYCQVCYDSQHRKGNRKRHATTPLVRSNPKKAKTVDADVPMLVQKVNPL